MKNSLMIGALLLSTMILSTKPVAAQGEGEAHTLKTFGIGVYVDQHQEISPMVGNKIVFTINVIDKLRFEPEFGIAINNRKDKAKVSGEDLASVAFHYGAGAFYMWPRTKANFYAGLRFGFNTLSVEAEDASDPANPVIVTDDAISLTYRPTLGGEYFFNQHFSLGAELGGEWVIRTDKAREGSNASDESSTSLYSVTSLLLHFYF